MNTIKLALSWIIVISFAITFYITIRALIGRCHIHEKYLSKLFTASILKVVAASLFLFYSPGPQGHPYTGEWTARIYWKPEYSRTLFNNGNENPDFQPVNPRSEGFLYFYVSKSGSYTGFSRWVAKNGEQVLSELVVIPVDFKFNPDGQVKSIELSTAFRKQLVQFSYAKYTRYRIEFYEVTNCRLRGKIIVYAENEEKEVGEVLLEQ